MVDFLGNKLEVGDNVVINQNTRTGSSTVRKMLKQCTVIGFTEHKVKTTMGNVFSEDVIKIDKLINNKIGEFVFKKSLWWRWCINLGINKTELIKHTWVDEIDGMKVDDNWKIDGYTIMREWCEEIKNGNT